jgi:hypothetical protein
MMGAALLSAQLMHTMGPRFDTATCDACSTGTRHAFDDGKHRWKADGATVTVLH